MGTIDTVLFGKYRLCRILGTGRAGTVFLAMHIRLEEYRAVKRVPKSFVDYERFRREAFVLKELRHPGIPIVYDLEEDEDYSYLIEEYLEGESLYDLVGRQGHLSREEAVSYSLQLARIVEYLHIAGPTPILHLDLQPKNLLLCHGIVKLIDFDHAADPVSANAASERYGTIGCAAPEQYVQGETLDERTDLYAIGVILYYLVNGRYPDRDKGGAKPHEPGGAYGPGGTRESNGRHQLDGPYQLGGLNDASGGYRSGTSASAVAADRALTEVMDALLQPDRNRRFSSAREVVRRLEALAGASMERGTLARGTLAGEAGGKDSQPLFCLAAAGSKPGAGTSHIAVGLSCCLSRIGCPNVYEERNSTGMGNALGTAYSAVRDRYGLMQHNGFVWKPAYGPGVRLDPPSYSIRVADYGCDVKQAVADRPDGILLVCDGSVWGQAAAEQAALIVAQSRLPYAIIYNHVPAADRITAPAGAAKKRCFKAPYYDDPFLRMGWAAAGRSAFWHGDGKQAGRGTFWRGDEKLSGRSVFYRRDAKLTGQEVSGTDQVTAFYREILAALEDGGADLTRAGICLESRKTGLLPGGLNRWLEEGRRWLKGGKGWLKGLWGSSKKAGVRGEKSPADREP